MRDKHCAKCGTWDQTKFTASQKSWCGPCHAANMREHRITKTYGMTMQAYDLMREFHGNRCAICGMDENQGARRLHIDHCHATGEARGLLCFRCNQTLGRVKDDPDLLDKMAAYLRRST